MFSWRITFLVIQWMTGTFSRWHDVVFILWNAGIQEHKMTIKPTVALRAMLVGGIAVFAKAAGVMKAAGGVKLGAAAAAMTAAATAAVAGAKQDKNDTTKLPQKWYSSFFDTDSIIQMSKLVQAVGLAETASVTEPKLFTVNVKQLFLDFFEKFFQS